MAAMPGAAQPQAGELDSSDTALLDTLLLEAPVAFAFYDTNLRYRRINRMLAEINGVPMRDHIGRTPTEVLPGPLGEAVEERLRQVLDRRQVITDQDFQGASPITGETRVYESQWFPSLAPDGTPTGVAVLVSDITERRHSEDALRRSIERTADLQRATAALAEAITVADVVRVVQRIGVSALGVHRSDIELGEGPVDAVTTQVGGAWETVLPLIVSGGPIGVLRLRLSEQPRPDDLTFLSAFAGQCAIALERARLYERERATAVALQHSLLPARLPDVPGVELAAQFRPGSPEADVGGDWYDAFTLPDGRLVLVVGDVMGKGVEAAAGMGRLRSALRALAHANPLPEMVLQGLDRVFTATEGADQIATLVYLLVNPAARRAAIGAAGHLPIVLQRAGGEPELVDAGAGSTPLGWPEPRSQRTLELGVGDLLIGFTDGLVERRGADIDEGLGELRELVAASGAEGDLQDLVERLCGTLMAATPGRDDATVLALRFTDVPELQRPPSLRLVRGS